MVSLEYGVNDASPSGKVSNQFVYLHAHGVTALFSVLFRSVDLVNIGLIALHELIRHQ
jgi:hypothetical protein